MDLADVVAREVGNKSREFYEFVLPPVDMHLAAGKLRIIIDMPGFAREDIEAVLCGSVLSVRASREAPDDGSLVWSQRPHRIDKSMRLPVSIREGEESIESATYRDGMLTLTIPVPERGKSAEIE